jgi:hypothetical protein
MSRWLLAILAALLVVATALAISGHAKSVAKNKREIGYQSALQRYSREVKLGSRRAEVENYLRSRNTAFGWMYTAYGGRKESQYADLVKIGEEVPPWFRSESYVYVAFEFSPSGMFGPLFDKPRFSIEQTASDVLERIELFQPDSGCL